LRIRWTWHVEGVGEMGNAYEVLVGKLQGKAPLGRPWCRWEDNIRISLRKIGLVGSCGVDSSN